MEENNNYITNVVIPDGTGTKTLQIQDANALHNAEYTIIKNNVNIIRAKIDELITKLSNMAYNIDNTDANHDQIPDNRPTSIGGLSW